MMTDFQNWWDGYFHEINGQKETAQAAWKTATLAERERIKELEAELAEWKEVGLGHDENARQAIKQLAELTANNKELEGIIAMQKETIQTLNLCIGERDD
jgi:acetoin utilization deacetylase AcuC-like enzyme